MNLNLNLKQSVSDSESARDAKVSERSRKGAFPEGSRGFPGWGRVELLAFFDFFAKAKILKKFRTIFIVWGRNSATKCL